MKNMPVTFCNALFVENDLKQKARIFWRSETPSKLFKKKKAENVKSVLTIFLIIKFCQIYMKGKRKLLELGILQAIECNNYALFSQLRRQKCVMEGRAEKFEANIDLHSEETG